MLTISSQFSTTTISYLQILKEIFFCGFTFDCNYDAEVVDAGMPGYIDNTMEKFQHLRPFKPQHSPFYVVRCVYLKNESDSMLLKLVQFYILML